MINIPTPLHDSTNMADWMEFRALTAADRNVSADDLKRVIVTAGEARTGGGIRTEDEKLVPSCFYELQDRARSSGRAYPFVIGDGIVRVKDEQNPCWADRFCLLLSLKGADRSEPGKSSTELFEEVAEFALREYVGKSVKFGFPRRVLPSNFKTALRAVLKELCEGEDVTAPPKNRQVKDAAVDLIAWRPFLDQRSAQLIVFGQCAAGANWQKKLNELNASAFSKNYWRKQPAVAPLRAFCTPFRISFDDWYWHATNGGILFDRCRIASLTCNQPAPREILRWCTNTTKELATATVVAEGKRRILPARSATRKTR